MFPPSVPITPDLGLGVKSLPTKISVKGGSQRGLGPKRPRQPKKRGINPAVAGLVAAGRKPGL